MKQYFEERCEIHMEIHGVVIITYESEHERLRIHLLQLQHVHVRICVCSRSERRPRSQQQRILRASLPVASRSSSRALTKRVLRFAVSEPRFHV